VRRREWSGGERGEERGLEEGGGGGGGGEGEGGGGRRDG